MSNKVQLACIECCLANGGELKAGTMAQTFIGECQCCGQVKPLSNIDYWKNLPRVKEWKSAVIPQPTPIVKEREEPPKAKNAPNAKGHKLPASADFS